MYEKEYKRIEESILQAYSKDYRQTNQMYQAIDRANQVLSDVNNKKSNKERSVVKDAVVGGIIAGPAGAVVGAINAADKNRKNSTKTK